jgi:hypothetical protein
MEAKGFHRQCMPVYGWLERIILHWTPSQNSLPRRADYLYLQEHNGIMKQEIQILASK